jgi:hypothetical protein
LAYTVRGFLLFDPEVSSEWLENKRLLPFEKPAVNLLVVVLFYVGIFGALRRRKGTFFLLIYLLNIALLQLLAAYPPSWSRAIGVLPALYYFAGWGIEQISLLGPRVREPVRRFVPVMIVILVLSAGFSDVKVYWDWIRGEDFAQAQEPAIKVDELARWQQLQLEELERGHKAFSIYEWQAGWDLTITEVKDVQWLDWDDRKLVAEGQWLVIIGDIKNLALGTISFSTREFVLRPLPVNGVFQLDEEATRAAGQHYGIKNAASGIRGVQIEPGQTVPFLVAFDAPEELEEAALQATNMLWYKIGSVEEPAPLPTDPPATQASP